jgi:hypothetical protein
MLVADLLSLHSLHKTSKFLDAISHYLFRKHKYATCSDLLCTRTLHKTSEFLDSMSHYLFRKHKYATCSDLLGANSRSTGFAFFTQNT